MERLRNGLEVRDGHLHLDGVDIVALARQVDTPFFLFSEDRLRGNAAAVLQAFRLRHADSEVFFASKANSNLWVLDRLRRTGIGVEVNSAGELWKALKVGFVPRQIVFNGVAKTKGEISMAVENGIRALVVDSVYELGRAADVAASYERPVAVDLRIDVGVETLTHPGLQTAHGGKAGIDVDDAVAAFARAAADGFLEPIGLHVHIGSQITSVEPYLRALETALDLAAEVEAATGVAPVHLNLGGGFAVPYRDAPVCEPVDYFCSSLSADDYAQAICEVMARRRPRLPLFVEPGRAIVGNAALLVTRIENHKVKGVRDAAGRRVGDERWLIVDAGFNTLLEHTNYRWYYRTVVANRAGDEADAEFRLAGPLCDGGDVFAGDGDTPFRRLPAATTAGDYVVFLDTGAYTLEMMSHYNGRPRAGAYAVSDADVVQIRMPENLDETVAQDVAPRVRLSGLTDWPSG